VHEGINSVENDDALDGMDDREVANQNEHKNKIPELE
jgi:hypothetical protein